MPPCMLRLLLLMLLLLMLMFLLLLCGDRAGVKLADLRVVVVAAIIVAVLVMMMAAGTISDFIDKHPSLKMLALSWVSSSPSSA